MRYLRYAFVALLGLVLLTVALANRGTVTLHLFPPEAGAFLGVDGAVDLPLFLVIFGGVIGGLLIGFVWEWLREHKHRAAAARHRREAARLEREVSRLRKTDPGPDDEILALLETPRKVS